MHCGRSGQPRQPAPNVAVRFALRRRVRPFGQVTVPAVSSMVNPPGTAGRSGAGLMIGV
jgi:hypothetical protein